jgi:glycosyltransferase involved in cell wall biosynthesis
MRACFVSHSGGAGGAERSLLDTVRILGERGVHCRVVVPRRGYLSGELHKRNVACHVIPYTWWMGRDTSRWKRYVKQFVNAIMERVLATCLRRWTCDIVYSNSVTVSAGAFAARRSGLPHVWHIHEFGYEHHGLTYEAGHEHAMKVVAELSDVCIVVSNALAQKYREHVSPDRLNVLYQPISPPSSNRDARAAETGEFRCIMVGGLNVSKGHEDAINALAYLFAGGQRVSLSIVGDGDAARRRALMSMAEASGVADRVTFHGFLEDPYPLIQSSSVLLVCSRHEGFGRTAVEAMLCGRPVIGANSGGTAELVREGFNGFLYEPGDSAGLAEKIARLLHDPAEGTRLGDNGRHWAQRTFDRSRYGEAILSLLHTVVGSRQRIRSVRTPSAQLGR